ncbi:hypothetical protein N865_07685 [Intrasporangium oryzae NRRL B-24470]|uniref:Uncharacterized protein n=1 Tax=Intrasporangium oryzae NRRL B-24470 TaxID=1386089 RepID=W9G924_9MICO|nr:hypothetical protein [Intrasporangium oryzae]EWT01757.1 hypothetical protein N865_07685 [Intrasporangium oryzae NRRL B-24470]
MTVRAMSCGLTLEVSSTSRSWLRFARDSFGGPVEEGGPADVMVTIEPGSQPFDVSGFVPLTRGAFGDGRRVVLTDACGSGVDLLVEPSEGVLAVTARPRPGPTHRGLRVMAPARTELLWRAALLQYPALWWAGSRNAVPLHVSAARVGRLGVVLAGPGGVGKSTLLGGLAAHAGIPVSDNLCTYDGRRVNGLPEPRRVSARRGLRPAGRMPHGRVERPWAERAPSVEPSLVLVLRRGTGEAPTVRWIPPGDAVRSLTTGTYAAGELRRYWAFAAALALGTGLGPAHPPIEGHAERLAASVRCAEVVLPATPVVSLEELVDLAAHIDDEKRAGVVA